ncbi:hypothetical protein ASPTUDRAFT_261567 [Aspergillus tubingensis CBS 134.48]|uniref:Uncharacterized protein n=1 Tax=Aspergillus tubingensis (strain CBS 134.48) TaxID=767770 RepID=A0A1L9NN88_ASPTC|nr:hypothetical protein ASPTUDRAFT_261567 [Aspergillus tubingensis CBS 134.48]
MQQPQHNFPTLVRTCVHHHAEIQENPSSLILRQPKCPLLPSRSKFGEKLGCQKKIKRPPHSWVDAVASFFTASKAKTPPPAYEITFCAMETQPLAIRSSPSSGLFDTVAVNPVRLVLIHHYVHPSAPPEYVSFPIIVRVCCTVVHPVENLRTSAIAASHAFSRP